MKRRSRAEIIRQSYEKDMKKLIPYGVKTDEQGRYLACQVIGGKLAQAYCADKTGARIRICVTTFLLWLEEGKAVEVSDEELPRRRKKKPSA